MGMGMGGVGVGRRSALVSHKIDRYLDWNEARGRSSIRN
jgi:hypothetical protein